MDESPASENRLAAHFLDLHPGSSILRCVSYLS